MLTHHMRHTILLPLLTILVGCAGAQPNFQGTTAADETLKKDTIHNIKYMIKTKAGCDKIDSVKSIIVHYDQQNRVADELWTAYGCNKEFPLYVNYKEDVRGGTFIDVKLAEE